MPKDPLQNRDTPTLADSLKSYEPFGGRPLQLSLLRFANQHGGPGISTPADAGASYYCPECEKNVRGVSLPGGPIVRCPLCGHEPGMLTLGTGPNQEVKTND